MMLLGLKLFENVIGDLNRASLNRIDISFLQANRTPIAIIIIAIDQHATNGCIAIDQHATCCV